MNFHKMQPRESLNKAFLKIKPNRNDIENFKKNLHSLIEKINESESEEFHKNLIGDFLKNTYYGANHFINTKGRNDFVIHNGKDAKSKVGVILEAKKPTNKSEMLKADNLNTKALQELVLYFLRERLTEKNLEIKYLIATNIYEWFIFDANIFEKAFVENKTLVQQFTDFEAGRLSNRKTDFFYKEIAKPAIDEIVDNITFTHFDIRECQQYLQPGENLNDHQLIPLFKLFSPEHLLKLPFANDSNTLDKGFYSELLHIIGLTETKEGGKKLIQRKKENERNVGSLIENAINQLDSLDKVSRLQKPEEFGETYQEQLFNLGLELAITWVNRILFLKLLEAQLIKYHKNDLTQGFLNLQKVQNYDDLNSLFFSVLARKQNERNQTVQKIFAHVPYLNSSLFEPTDNEQVTICINNLRNENLQIFSSTILKDSNGKKRIGEINALEYLFEFLNAYDFSSETGEEIQEENKRLINAAVLGLIFEKINGYKDGSFFTPGFITMYMCRETIRRAVVQKFNEVKGWSCENINDLYEKIEDRKEANIIINSLKICDPAVGSGHFLVSALNEIIAIKSELKILLDREGKRLKEYDIEVVNDELIVIDDEKLLFEYNPKSKESQRVQETLFHEKQTIIENCLFGVDINPNSVKICQLRLWIELLKNAYYRTESNYTELETLPNIDINIKPGNSLISRFSLDADLRVALNRSKCTIESYRNAVQTYRNAENKEQKREMERFINDIKGNLKTTLQGSDPNKTKLRKLEGEVENLENQDQQPLFEETKTEKNIREKKIIKLNNEIDKLRVEIEDIDSGKIYENAFEWRFEFPEVLNDEGIFIGFDVVIGNPPYITYHGRRRVIISNEIINYFKNQYDCAKDTKKDGKFNSAMFFIEKSTIIGNENSISCLITDISFYEDFYTGIKRILINSTLIIEVVNGLSSFEDVGSGQLILLFKYLPYNERKIINNNKVRFLINGLGDEFRLVNQKLWDNVDKKYQFYLPENNYNSIIEKFETNNQTLEFYFPYKLIRTGESVGVQEQGFVIDSMVNEDDIKIYEYLEGSKSVPSKYCKPIPTRWFRFDMPLLNQRNEAYKIEAKSNNRNNPKVLGIGDELAFDNPKILIRQSCDHLCCTYSEKPFVYNRSYYSISTKNISGKSSNNLFYVLGLLNSKLFTYYAQKTRIIRMEVGKQPQIRLNDLKKLPIKYANSEAEEEIITKVKAILSIKESDPNADTTALETEIDQLVYQLYELTAEEIKIIEG